MRHLAERMMADPVAVSHAPAVAERFRYDHLVLTGPERSADGGASEVLQENKPTTGTP